MITTRVNERVARCTYPVNYPGVPPANVYVILDQEPILVDCGPDGPVEPLLEDLRALGVSEVRHLVITHGHIDHFGLARRLRERWPSMKIYLHRDDVLKCTLRDEDRRPLGQELRDIIRSWGVAQEVVLSIQDKIIEVMRLGPPLEPSWITMVDGGVIRVGDVELQVTHTPGHTEGSICLTYGDLLFSGDHLLEDITPNPALYLPAYRGKRTGLGDYIESLKRTTQARRVLPGHGAPYEDPAARARQIETAYRERRDAILRLLNGTPRSVSDLTMTLWSNLDPLTFFLGAREVHGHLEILEREGLVRSHNGRFSKVTL